MAKIRNILGEIRGSIAGITVQGGQAGTGIIRRKPRARREQERPEKRGIQGIKALTSYLARRWSNMPESNREIWRRWAGSEGKGRSEYIALNHNRMRLKEEADAIDTPPQEQVKAEVTSLVAVRLENERGIKLEWEIKGESSEDDIIEVSLSGPYVSGGKVKSIKWWSEEALKGDKTEATVKGLMEGVYYWARVRHVTAAGQTSAWIETQCENWSPLTLGGCVGWYRSDLSVVIDSNKGVKVWGDQSEREMDVRQSVPNRRPKVVRNEVAGNNGIKFDGIDDRLKSGEGSIITQPITEIIVIRSEPTEAEHNYVFVDGLNGPDRVAVYFTTYENKGYGLFCGTGLIWITDELAGWHVCRVLARGTSSEQWWDGELKQTGDAGTGGLKGLIMGSNCAGSYPAKMTLAEVILFGRELSSNEAGKINGYLGSRYGIQLNDS